MEGSPAEERPLAPVHRLTLARSHAPVRVGLSNYDKAAVTAFVGGDELEVARLIEDTRALADALVGEDADGARVRLLGRAVAAARTQQRLLEALLGERLASRDAAGIEMVSKVLDGVTRRLAMFLKQMAVESSLKRRPTVVIRHADAVNFGEERS